RGLPDGLPLVDHGHGDPRRHGGGGALRRVARASRARGGAVSPAVLAACLLAGVGTWALRVVPLLVSGLEPYLVRAAGEVGAGATGAALREVAALAAGLGATAGAYLWRRDVALGTVGGAAAYGLAAWLLGV